MVKILKTLKAGDVVSVNLDPTKGSETKKIRPCLVITEASPLDLAIVVPITNDNGKRSLDLFVSVGASKETGLVKNSSIDCFQIRVVSKERISKVLGSVTEPTMNKVKCRLALILDIGDEHIGGDH